MNKKPTTVKTLVIGLDGATFSLLRPIVDSGRMPFLAHVMATGTSGPLRSTLPPVTAPAWSSFLTGKNPGNHGLFSWQRSLTGDVSNQRNWVSSPDIRGKKVWHILSTAGWKSGMVNVPMTYPAEPIDGFMVTGLLTPDMDSTFTYPDEIKQDLRQVAPDYVIDIGDIENTQTIVEASQQTFDRFIEEATQAARTRTTAAISLVEKHRPDFFMLVYTLPDRLQHAAYEYMATAATNSATSSHRAQASLAALLSLDQEIERLVTSITDPDSLIVLISDHGFCHHRYNVYLNGWLAENDLLHYKGKTGSFRQSIRGIARRLRALIPRKLIRVGRQALSANQLIDWSTTKAYCGQSTENGIYINLKGRQPCGIVEAEEYEALRDTLITKLSTIINPDTQETILKVTYPREDIYRGPYVDQAPDIVFEAREGYKFMTTPVPDFQVRDVSDKKKGIHAMNGVFIAHGPMIKSNHTVADARIIDVLPTMLHAINLPIPESVDGQVLTSIFQKSHQVPIHYTSDVPQDQETDDEAIYSDTDAMTIKNRLQKLGYLD